MIFDGIDIYTEIAGATGEFVDKQEHDFFQIDDCGTAEIVDRPKQLNSKTIGGIAGGGIEEPWFDNIIIDPTEIDFEFIVDNIAREFKIISTYRRHEDTKTMSLFNEVNFEGLQSLGVTVPNDITAECSEIFTIIALRDGPATQASQIVTQIDSETFTINIQGLRVALFPFLPNWTGKYTVGLIFKSVILKTSFFFEQRRAIHKEPRHRTVFDIMIKEVSSRNLLRQLSKKTLGIPWFNDFVSISSIVDNIVNTNNSMDELAFLPVSKFLCFIDESDPTNNEVVEIDSFTSNQVICKKNIEIVAENICCYPLYLGTIKVQQEKYPAPIASTYTIIAEEL